MKIITFILASGREKYNGSNFFRKPNRGAMNRTATFIYKSSSQRLFLTWS